MSLTERIRTKGWRAQKWLRWHLLPRAPVGQRQVLLIVGCQRSGTTLLGRIFEIDSRTAVLHEDSAITGHQGQRLRLKPYDEVERILARLRVPLIVAKPLVESQNTPTMLQRIPNAKAVWMFRHYRAVARSSVNRFRRQMEHLQAVLLGDRGRWHAEGVSDATQAIVAECFSPDISRYDAAALLWYVRNVLFVELDLANRADVATCKYEELVQRPEATMRRLYGFVGLDYPRRDIVRAVDCCSIRLADNLQLSPKVERLCRGLLHQLETFAGPQRLIR